MGLGRLLYVALCAALLSTAGCNRVNTSQELDTPSRPTNAEPARDGGVGRAPADSSAAANRGTVVRRLSGRAFVIDDFGAVPTGNPAEVVRQLEAQARGGDANASYGIFLKINECLAVSKRAAQGLQSRANPDVVMACRQLAADDAAKSAEWLSLAAEQGNVSAQLLYASDPESVLGDSSEILRDPDRAKEYKAKAIDYLRSAANQGSVDALLRLANAYDVGVLASRDPVSSLAYFNAVGMVDPSLVPQKQVEMLRQSMDAGQLASSLKQGEGIYGSCCR